jgi:hypothetical protein
MTQEICVTRLLILIISLLLSTSVFAQRQACVVHIESDSDVEKLSCSEGDYVTFWSDSDDRTSVVKVSAAMMHSCDLSKPFQVASASSDSPISSATCTLTRIRLPVIHEDAKSKEAID